MTPVVEPVMAGGSGYSPVGMAADGTVHVELAPDHPGVADPAYRARRGEIAALALAWRPEDGDPPTVAYTDDEHRTWATVRHELQARWEAAACERFLAGVDALDLPTERVPQLAEVSAALGPRTGFRYLPAAGLVPLRRFYGSFAEGTFWSTQYLRHGAEPLYTPEPDLCHEVLGHAHQLADPATAEVYRQVAACAARLETDVALARLSHVFWFTMEFGVVREAGCVKAFGAGLLSSFGELGALDRAELRDLDWVAMADATYDITHYQPVLYACPSTEELLDRLTTWLAAFTD